MRWSRLWPTSPPSPNGRTNSTRRTIACERGDLVAVPFPHVERAVIVRRPALVIARHDTGRVGALLWTVMITNATRPGWAGDVDIPDAESLGLVIPSKVRTAKVTTVEEAAVTPIGRLDDGTWRQVAVMVLRSIEA